MTGAVWDISVHGPETLARAHTELVARNLLAGLERVRVVPPGAAVETTPALVLAPGWPLDPAPGVAVVDRTEFERLLALYSSDVPERSSEIALEPWVDALRERVMADAGVRFSRRGAVVAITHDVDSVRPHTMRSFLHYLRRPPGSRAASFPSWRAYVRACSSHAVRAAVWSVHPAEPEIVRWWHAERELGLRSTYYFQEDRADRHDLRNAWYGHGEPLSVDGRRMRLCEFMRTLAGDGFEIGPHPGIHSVGDWAAYRQAVDSVRRCGGSARSTRHHWISVDPHHGLDVMEAVGIGLDLNFGSLGFDAGTCTPWLRFDRRRDRQSSVLAIPTVFSDDLALKATRRALSPEAALETVSRIAKQLRRFDGVAAIAFHPDAYPNIDKLAFFRSLVATLREQDVRLTTAAEAGDAARRRLPVLVG